MGRKAYTLSWGIVYLYFGQSMFCIVKYITVRTKIKELYFRALIDIEWRKNERQYSI